MEKQTLGEAAAASLIRWIRENGCQPGSKLPTEGELSQMLGVSRNTLREALRILMSRNIVNIRQGSGTFVSDKMGIPDDPLGFLMVQDQRRLTEDLIQVRMILEPSIAAFAAQNAEEQEILELEKLVGEVEALVEKREDYREKDSAFHAKIAECTHNLVMKTLIPVITDGVKIFAGSVRKTEYEQTIISHRKILNAIRDHRPEDARQAMLFHLMYNENRYWAEVQEPEGKAELF